LGATAIERRVIDGAVALELLSAKGASQPVVFVHGAYVGAWCWAEHWLEWFAGEGWDAHAVSLRGHGKSGGRDRLHEFGLADYAEDLCAVLAGLEPAPVLVGHSMGALVVQKALERGAACAAMVLVCPVPPFGLLPASFSLAFTRPALFAEIQAMAAGHRVSLDALQQALLAGPVEAERLQRIYSRMQPESRRAMLDMSGWGLPAPWGASRVPTLVLGAEKDALIPAHFAETSARMLGAEYQRLEGCGHAVMLDAQWRDAAQVVRDWLDARKDASGVAAGAR